MTDMKKQLTIITWGNILGITFFLILLSFSGLLYTVPVQNQIEIVTTPHSSSLSYNARGHSIDYTPHNPISIESDGQLASIAVNGKGDINDPYILEGWNITVTTQTNGIFIGWTTKYFMIRNCWVSSTVSSSTGFSGIVIQEVSEGTATIVNNTIQNNNYGILLCNNGNSGFSKVLNNICQNNYNDGINLGSSNNTITNNTASNNGAGGIWLGNSSHNLITNNTVAGNGGGISLNFASNNNIIQWNNIIDNNMGIFIDGNNNIITNNDLSGNSPGGSSQAYDDGSDNVFDYNYWSDHTSPDDDADGIVDTKYDIDGSAVNADPHPKTEASSRPPEASSSPSINITTLDPVPVLLGLVLAIELLKYRRTK